MCTISQKCSKGVGGWGKVLGDGKTRFRDKVIILDVLSYPGLVNIVNSQHLFT